MLFSLNLWSKSLKYTQTALQRCSYKNVFTKICSKFTGEHLCWKAILVCFANLLKMHFGTGVYLEICCMFLGIPFHKNNSGGLLVKMPERVHYRVKLQDEGLQLYKKCSHVQVYFKDFDHRFAYPLLGTPIFRIAFFWETFNDCLLISA